MILVISYKMKYEYTDSGVNQELELTQISEIYETESDNKELIVQLKMNKGYENRPTGEYTGETRIDTKSPYFKENMENRWFNMVGLAGIVKKYLRDKNLEKLLE